MVLLVIFSSVFWFFSSFSVLTSVLLLLFHFFKWPETEGCTGPVIKISVVKSSVHLSFHMYIKFLYVMTKCKCQVLLQTE